MHPHSIRTIVPSPWLTRVLLLCATWIAAPALLNHATATDLENAQPLWQTGVSTFTGSGYELPPVESLSTPAAEASKPYTMPTQPGTAAPPAIQNPYALPQALQPVAGGTTAQPSPVTQVAGYSPLSDAPTLAPPVQNDGVTDAQIVEQINNQLNSSVETPPLREEVVSWYQYPIRWMKGWDSNAEFGIDGSSGNADTLALQTGLELKRKTDAYTFAIDVDYRQASSRDVTTEDNGRFNLDYDRILGDTPWSVFGKLGLEWDKFKAFDLRLNMNSGLGYHWIRTDDTTLVTRFGAGASKEFGSPDDAWTPEAVFGLEAERQLTSRQKVKGKLDYFPAWEDFADYRLVADVSWEILLDGSENLSLKVAATDRYDSTPQGARPNDVYYSLLLLYKF
ncbi:DUF481 domain-containing protein [Rubripirellula amarantea]|nr:DUF481 domain-containing protein [Rubripirellula amarantea]